MQSNCAKRGECGRLKIYMIGKRGKQIARDHIVFGMNGISTTGTGDTLSDPETLHVLSKRDDRAGRGIAQCHRLIETVECCLRRVHQSFPTGLIQHLLDQVGT